MCKKINSFLTPKSDSDGVVTTIGETIFGYVVGVPPGLSGQNVTISGVLTSKNTSDFDGICEKSNFGGRGGGT